VPDDIYFRVYSTVQTKLSLGAEEALEATAPDIWTLEIASELEGADLAALRACCTAFRTIFADEDMWLNKLTALTLEYPTLSALVNGEGEPAFAWYGRCYAAVAGGRGLALAHKAGEMPFLKLYGSFDESTFTPHTPLAFPIECGVLAELATLNARAGKGDPSGMDLLAYFTGAPSTLDSTMRLLVKNIKAATQRATSVDLRKLPDLLAERYAPPEQAVRRVDEPSAVEPTAVATPPPRAAPTASPTARSADALRRRLGRMATELARAHARIGHRRARDGG
jgi:hypothetical protein